MTVIFYSKRNFIRIDVKHIWLRSWTEPRLPKKQLTNFLIFCGSQPFLHEVGSHLFVINPFIEKAFFFQISLTLSQICSGTSNYRKLEVAKVTGNFPIWGFSEITFRKLSISWPIFNLNDVIRHFCSVTTSTYAFSSKKQTQKQNLNRLGL